MNTFYTLNRRLNSPLIPGMPLTLSFNDKRFGTIFDYNMKRTLLKPSQLSLECLDEINITYPNGVSPHGYQYLLLPSNSFDHDLRLNKKIEVYLEEIRRLKFPHLHSRYESMFGFQTLKEAMGWKDTNGMSFNIFEILTENDYLIADMMNLSSFGDKTKELNATLYWKGLPNNQGKEPIWEVLIKLPVKVGRQVNLNH